MLALNDVTAGYETSHILHGVSLAVDSGEIVCLLGPNGAGKSTVLRAIFQLATVYEGSIVFRGRDITPLHTHELLELGIGFVPQGRINFSTMTVRENLEMGGFLLNHRHALLENMEFVLEQFPPLRALLDRSASTLSGGEGQMLAVARALMMRPSLLLLDEPSLGLAPKIVADMFSHLRRLVQQGMTILLVEQNVHLALQLAQRGYLLAGGRILFQGSANALHDPERMRQLYLGGILSE